MVTLLTGLPFEWITEPRGSVSLLTASSSASGVLRAYVPVTLWIVWPIDQKCRTALVPSQLGCKSTSQIVPDHTAFDRQTTPRP